MTAKNFNIQTPEQVTKPVSEMKDGQMFVRPDKLDQPCLVASDMAGCFHVVDINMGRVYAVEAYTGTEGHPVKDIKCTLILQ